MEELLIEELENSMFTINIDLDWDINVGTFEYKDYLFDYLPTFYLQFDIYVRQEVDFEEGDYYTPPNITVLEENVYIENVKVVDRATDKEMKIEQNINEYIINLVNFR